MLAINTVINKNN